MVVHSFKVPKVVVSRLIIYALSEARFSHQSATSLRVFGLFIESSDGVGRFPSELSMSHLTELVSSPDPRLPEL